MKERYPLFAIWRILPYKICQSIRSRIFSSFTNHGTRYSKRYIVSNPEDADTLARADLRDLDLEGINLEGKSLNTP